MFGFKLLAIPAAMDVRFSLTGYDDAVESFEEWAARMLADEEEGKEEAAVL